MHPMEEKHYIRFIDVYQNDKFIARMMLTPLSVYPAACFYLKEAVGKINIVENCSIHWRPGTFENSKYRTSRRRRECKRQRRLYHSSKDATMGPGKVSSDTSMTAGYVDIEVSRY